MNFGRRTLVVTGASGRLGRRVVELVASGQLAAPSGHRGAAYVTREDCAGVAAAALASSDFDGRTIDVTGPAAVTHAELAKIAGDISRSRVTCVPSPPGSIFDMAIAKGWLGTATDAVLELTGQRATSVAEFLAEHIDFLIEAVVPSRAFASNRSR